MTLAYLLDVRSQTLAIVSMVLSVASLRCTSPGKLDAGAASRERTQGRALLLHVPEATADLHEVVKASPLR